MKEFKGTNQNWQFRKWERNSWPEKRWSVGVNNGKAICISPRYDFETEESEANAKLIATAPELLEALQCILESSNDIKKHLSYDKFLMDSLDKAFKVVDKALTI